MVFAVTILVRLLVFKIAVKRRLRLEQVKIHEVNCSYGDSVDFLFFFFSVSFLNKHSLNFSKFFINFQSSENFDFDNFCQCFHCLCGGNFWRFLLYYYEVFLHAVILALSMHTVLNALTWLAHLIFSTTYKVGTISIHILHVKKQKFRLCFPKPHN